MGDELDDFVNGVQNQILEETRAEFGDVAFERWPKPLYAGALDNPDGHGRVTGSCGDTMQIFLKFKKKQSQSGHIFNGWLRVQHSVRLVWRRAGAWENP